DRGTDRDTSSQAEARVIATPVSIPLVPIGLVIVLQIIGLVHAVLLQRVRFIHPILLQLLRIPAVLRVVRLECAVAIRKSAAVANAAITTAPKARIAAAIHETAVAKAAAETPAIKAAATATKPPAAKAATAEAGRNVVDRDGDKCNACRAGEQRGNQLLPKRRRLHGETFYPATWRGHWPIRLQKKSLASPEAGQA